jgi:hypothetical protein
MDPGIGVPTEGESPSTPLLQEGYTGRPSAGRSSGDVKEEDPALELEMKPQPPPQVPSGTPADRDASRDPQEGGSAAKSKEPSSTSSHPSSRSGSGSKKTPQMKMKAPEYDPDEGDGADAWSEEQLELISHRKELEEQLIGDPVLKVVRLKLIGNLRGPISAPSEPKDKLDAVKLLLHVLKEDGFTTGAFDANKLFDMELGTVVKGIEGLVDKQVALVGTSPPAKAEAVPVPPSNWPRYHFTAPIPDITMPVKPKAVRTPRSGSMP